MPLPRKAQAAMEFLITYGWAILAVLITLGALSYFGVLSPSNLLPEKCSFPSSIGCPDFEVGDSGIKIILQNNFGKAVKITSLSFTSDALNMLSGSCSTGTISAALKNGEKATFYANDPLNCNFKNTGRKKNKYGVLVNYQLLDTALPRLLDGELRAQKGDAAISGGQGEYGGGSGDSTQELYSNFNEGSGTTTSDLSGNGNTGTLTSFACTTLDCNPNSGWTASGKRGNAIKFDGVDDRVNMGNGAGVNLGNSDFTVAGWFKRSGSGTENGQLISKFGSGRGNYEVYWADCGANVLSARWTVSGAWRVVCFTDVISTGVWYHFALVHSGNSMLSYLNGAYKRTTDTTGTIDSVTNDLLVGMRYPIAQPFNGYIDEVQIFNRALSAQEIAALAAS